MRGIIDFCLGITAGAGQVQAVFAAPAGHRHVEPFAVELVGAEDEDVVGSCSLRL